MAYFYSSVPKWNTKKIFFIATGFGLFLFIYMYMPYYKVVDPDKALGCHYLSTVDKLPDIQDTEVKQDESIFFIETSCKSFINGKIVINARQACAVESAALKNPHKTIYLLYAAPGVIHDDETENHRLIKNLMSYSNVKILHLDVGRFIKETPVENLWSSGQIKKSQYIIEHTSDILRSLTLWKYGGIYLDLDVIVIKDLGNLPLNFVGAEDNTLLGSCVLSFTKKGEGHRHANALLHNLSEHFDGISWAENGPMPITRLLLSLCNTKDISKVINKSCQGMKIYTPDAFYPIHWTSWEILFDKTKIEYVQENTKNSYLIHIWNKLSHETKIPLQDNVPYFDLARRYCPGTIKSLEKYF